jgi:hypothetical protein
MWVDAAQGLAGESTGLNNFSIGIQPQVGHGAQAGIGWFHPATRYLFKQFGDGVGLGDGGNRIL